MALTDAVDATISEPDRTVGEPFLIAVQCVQTITGRGTDLTGLVKRNRIEVASEVEVLGLSEPITTVVTGIESFRRTMSERSPGQRGDAAARRR